MGLFDKFKNIFNKNNKEEVEAFDKGLEKTRNEFVNKIKNVEIYKKNLDLFEENIVNPLKNNYGMDFNI